jgi:hypothetical protein
MADLRRQKAGSVERKHYGRALHPGDSNPKTAAKSRCAQGARPSGRFSVHLVSGSQTRQSMPTVKRRERSAPAIRLEQWILFTSVFGLNRSGSDVESQSASLRSPSCHSDPFVNFREIAAGLWENSAAGAVCPIQSEADQHRLRLLVKSDDPSSAVLI